MSQTEQLVAARNHVVGAYQLPMRKRDVRGLARAGSLGAAGLLTLNVMTFRAHRGF